MKVKTINARVVLRGQGVVNFDSRENAYFYARGRSDTSNQKYAKTVVEKVISEDGKISYLRKVKISANALRNAIFAEDQPAQTSHVLASNRQTWPFIIGNEHSLLRGYLLTYGSSGSGLAVKRKSPLMVTDAVQVNQTVLKPEAGSTSGARTDTSYYEIDSIGEVEYIAYASLDLSELGFLSCDPIFDRPAFIEDDYPTIRELLKEKLETDIPPEPGYYTKVASALKLPERGVLFSPNVVYRLTIAFLKKLQRISIVKNTAYAHVQSVDLIFSHEGEMGLDFTADPDVTYGPRDNLVKLLDGKLSPELLYSAYRPSKPTEIEAAKIAELELAGKKLSMAKKDEARTTAKTSKEAAKKKSVKPTKEAEALADD